jgi:hypothetical protein
LNIVLYDKNYNIKKNIFVPNLVVTSGFGYIAGRIAGNTQAMSHMAVGTINTAPNISQTTLESELSRVELTGSGSVGSTATFNATFGPNVASGTLVEAGIFNDEISGIMLCRTTFPPLVKTDDDILTINWNIVVV